MATTNLSAALTSTQSNIACALQALGCQRVNFRPRSESAPRPLERRLAEDHTGD